eukprot:TRINITY_DN783_c0_g2_i1.p2 TRINITY_DN783_c0_g2~~TRINITY_DN783_c0_g2_i1.p2  ORF type:complete len:1063 (+),score=370.10 TRINITY_DN783_c0_g2_i1:116-3190(+)
MPAPDGAGSVHDYEEAKTLGKVVLVGRTTCTYCQRAKQLLQETLSGNPGRVAIFMYDEISDGDAVLAAAKRDSGNHPTVPIIFMGNDLIGGCDSLMKMKDTGDLYIKLGVAAPAGGGREVDLSEPRGPPPCPGLFFFPHTVNSWVIRGVALQVTIIAIIGIIFRKKSWAAWLILGLCADFCVRFIAGGVASPLGAFSQLCTVGLQERFVGGAPKQFATAIGVCFSAAAAGCLLGREDGIAGSVILGCLAAAASLEAFLDFCAGCWFFGYLIKFGLVPESVNDMHIGQKALVAYQAEQVDSATGFGGKVIPTPEKYKHQQPGQPKTAADVRVKIPKTDDNKRVDWNPIKHVKFADFLMPLGMGGLALCWKFAHYIPGVLDSNGRMTDNEVWEGLTYVGLAVWLVLLALLLIKLFRYPRRIWSEISDPIRSNSVAAFGTSLVLYGFLIYEAPENSVPNATRTLSVVMFWTGAAMMKLLLVWRLADLVRRRGDSEIVTPRMLTPFAGCVVCALVAPFYDGYSGAGGIGYYEVGWFFFGAAGLFCVLFTAAGILEAVRYHWSDERVRPSLAMWVVAIHLTFVAWTILTRGTGLLYNTGGFAGAAAVSAGPAIPNAANLDGVGHTLYFAGVTLFMVMLMLACPMGFIFRLKFDFSFWVTAFPVDVLCMATLVYHKATRSSTGGALRDTFSLGWAYTTLAVASYVNATLFLNTLVLLVKRRWLRAEAKWAPLSFNKITHEAFRFSGERMLRMARALEQSPSLEVAQGLCREWQLYSLVLEWHAHQENAIMFREVDAFNPLVTANGYRQHQKLESMEHGINTHIGVLLSATELTEASSAALRGLASGLEEYVPFMARHMDWEEENLLNMNRRTFSMDIQIRIVRKIWDAYECKSVEEFRAAFQAEQKHGPAPQGGWSDYHLAQFRASSTYGLPALAKDEDMFDFPGEHPSGEVPIEKRHVWRVVLPWVIHNLDMPMMRTRFVRALTWAVPERAQLIGEMIYRGVEDHEWNALAVDVPEIIPRGLPGWLRRI